MHKKPLPKQTTAWKCEMKINEYRPVTACCSGIYSVYLYNSFLFHKTWNCYKTCRYHFNFTLYWVRPNLLGKIVELVVKCKLSWCILIYVESGVRLITTASTPRSRFRFVIHHFFRKQLDFRKWETNKIISWFYMPTYTTPNKKKVHQKDQSHFHQLWLFARAKSEFTRWFQCRYTDKTCTPFTTFFSNRSPHHQSNPSPRHHLYATQQFTPAIAMRQLKSARCSLNLAAGTHIKKPQWTLSLRSGEQQFKSKKQQQLRANK